MAQHGLKRQLKIKAKRLQEMDRQLRTMAHHYTAYKRLVESCMEVIRSQSELIEHMDSEPHRRSAG